MSHTVSVSTHAVRDCVQDRPGKTIFTHTVPLDYILCQAHMHS